MLILANHTKLQPVFELTKEFRYAIISKRSRNKSKPEREDTDP